MAETNEKHGVASRSPGLEEAWVAGESRPAIGHWPSARRAGGGAWPVTNWLGLGGVRLEPMRARPATKTVSDRQSPGTSAGSDVWVSTKAFPVPVSQRMEIRIACILFCASVDFRCLTPTRSLLPSRITEYVTGTADCRASRGGWTALSKIGEHRGTIRPNSQLDRGLGSLRPAVTPPDICTILCSGPYPHLEPHLSLRQSRYAMPPTICLSGFQRVKHSKQPPIAKATGAAILMKFAFD